MQPPRLALCGLAAVIACSFALPLRAQQAAGDAAVVPFTIEVPEAVLTDLRARLEATRFPDEIDDADWDYGTPLAYLRELVEYWRDEFDWRAQERRLNELDQFKTTIDGLGIHFIHQRSPHADAFPLLLLNGWPSSIDEYAKVIGPLTDPVRFGGAASDAFHVVIPAMPGYGFSDKPRERGFDTGRMADFWVALMARLGYTRYAVHGSDWGAGVAAWLARKDPEHIVGVHIVGCEGVLRSAVPLGRTMEQDGFGYVEIQGTRTQTLGYGLNDSPAGLAAWIVEKYHGWTDHDGDVESVYTRDELLTNIMIYWVTNSITSASRIYYESRHGPGRPQDRPAMPTGCAAFVERYDRRARTGPEARQVAEQRYNVARWTDMPRGGHFPALEAPALWLDDLRAFFAELRQESAP